MKYNEKHNIIECDLSKKSFEYVYRNLPTIAAKYKSTDPLVSFDCLSGIKSKAKDYMHQIRVGYNQDNDIVLRLERITNKSNLGEVISKISCIRISPETALILSNILYDIVDYYYQMKLVDAIRQSQQDCEIYRNMR